MFASKQTKLKSLPEAAEELGVSVACLRSWVYRRAVPFVKIGRLVKISEATIQRIIAEGTVPALKERQ